MRGRGAYTFTPDRLLPVIVNAFAQGTIRLIDSLEVTLGAKFEHNTITGPAFQPTTRLMWKASARQRAWAAVSRALRTPSLINLGVHVEYPATLAIPALQLRRQIGSPAMPVLIGAVGNPDFRSERLLNAEAGYRLNLAQRAAIDVVAFGGRYNDLQTFEPHPPVVELMSGEPVMRLLSRHENLLRADTRGAEVSGRVQLGDAWQIDSALATFHGPTQRRTAADVAFLGFRPPAASHIAHTAANAVCRRVTEGGSWAPSRRSARCRAST
jgi:iron complex outermembrane receptor protein